MYNFSLNFAQATTVPNLISISYGLDEDATCHSIVVANCTNVATYMQRTNVEFMKIGLRGVSILVSSGDSGANSRSDGLCLQKKFNLAFPTSSPYVTSVGATQLQSNSYS